MSSSSAPLRIALTNMSNRHLIKNRYIDPLYVEYELALLSISYLSLPAMVSGIQEPETENNIFQGVFSFYDYAISSWAVQLELGIEGASTPELLEQLAKTIEVFLNIYFIDSSKPIQVSRTLLERLQPLSKYDFHDRLSQAMTRSRKQKYDGISDLPDVTSNFRTILEKIASSSPEGAIKAKLAQNYGPNWYKCSRVNCQYFHKGFASEEQRNDHVERHEKPFFCTSEDCPPMQSDHASLKELQEHMLESHGIGAPSDLEFPEPSTSKNTPIHPLKFKCDLCSKGFTRALNLQSHMRSHNNEKPFICHVCDAAFSRQNDLKRHSKLHSGGTSYVCEGFLENGAKWGCGRTFSRLDKLKEHHKSAVGIKCRERLLEEDKLLKRNAPQEDKKRGPTVDGSGHIIAGNPLLFDHTFEIAPLVTSPPLPKGLTEDMTSSTSTSFQSSINEKEFCQKCGVCVEGEHDLRKHHHYEHKVIVKATKKWVCIEPLEFERHYKPEVPISKCKPCSVQKMKYSSSYNAATHLQRAHFKQRKGRKIGPSNEKTGGRGDWPPMSELKHWIKEIDDPSYETDVMKEGEVLESDTKSSIWRSEPELAMDPMPEFLLDFPQQEHSDFFDFSNTAQEGEGSSSDLFGELGF